MDIAVNNTLFTDLTDEETAALNGGHYCYYVWVLRCYIQYYRRVCYYVSVLRCV